MIFTTIDKDFNPLNDFAVVLGSSAILF